MTTESALQEMKEILKGILIQKREKNATMKTGKINLTT
jgi:hypothetical protein